MCSGSFHINLFIFGKFHVRGCFSLACHAISNSFKGFIVINPELAQLFFRHTYTIIYVYRLNHEWVLTISQNGAIYSLLI